jgi:hypothetical protein
LQVCRINDVNDQQAKWRIAPRLEDLAVVEALDGTRFIGRPPGPV